MNGTVGPVRVITRTRTLRWRSVRFRSGPDRGSEPNLPITSFGRRACVGKHLANESLFIYIATTLWAATLERVRGKDGKEVPLDVNAFVDTGMV